MDRTAGDIRGNKFFFSEWQLEFVYGALRISYTLKVIVGLILVLDIFDTLLKNITVLELWSS